MTDKIEPVGGSPDSTRGEPARGRFQKLADALRDNLRKRKQQQRARAEEERRRRGEDDPSVVPSQDHITDIEA
jgi:hypothetical protein